MATSCYTQVRALAASFRCRSRPDCACAPCVRNHGAVRLSIERRLLCDRGSLFFNIAPDFSRPFTTSYRWNCRSNTGVVRRAADAFSDDFPPDALANAQGSDASDPVAAAIDVNEERLGGGEVNSKITMPMVNTTGLCIFNSAAELIEASKGEGNADDKHGHYRSATVVLEGKISELVGAESTMVLQTEISATISMLMALVPNGGHVLTTTDWYTKRRMFIEAVRPELMDILLTAIDATDIGALESELEKKQVSLFVTDSPTDPFLKCVDIELVSQLCHNKGALVCIDGTLTTPFNQRALALGADLVLYSAQTLACGTDVEIGACICGSMELVTAIRDKRSCPLDGVSYNQILASSIIQSMPMLHLLVQQSNSTALRMATFLEAHCKIKCVYYPGLPNHPQHHIAKQQMIGFGSVVSFEVDGDLIATNKFVNALNITYHASSVGGINSLVDQPVTSYWDINGLEESFKYVKDNLVRFSVGLEPFEELKADVLQALDSI